MGARINLALGPIAPSIAEQLRGQGLQVEDAEHFERARAAVTRLYLAEYLTEAETKKARRRIADAVFATARSIPALASSTVLPQEASRG